MLCVDTCDSAYLVGATDGCYFAALVLGVVDHAFNEL
jgi:hypothetical protein